MATKLAYCVNKTVFVAVPVLFEDARPRLCKVVEIEWSGIWLESDEFRKRIDLGDHKREGDAKQRAFVPFSQIAYLLDPTKYDRSARKAALARAMRAARQKPSQEKPPDDVPRRRRDVKPGHKGPKPKR